MQFVQWSLENVWFMRENAGGTIFMATVSSARVSFLFLEVSMKLPPEDYLNSFSGTSGHC